VNPEASQESRTPDRRVLRSRSALFGAAVRLVSERGTTAIPVTDLAEAADVSRRLVYLQFGDRESLFVEAAADLVGRELVTRAEGDTDDLARVLTLARHFAQYRPFYRAMLTGSCAFAMTRTLNALFGSLNKKALRELFGELDEDTTEDLAAFVAAGTGAVVNDWLIGGDDPLDPEALAHRLLRLASVLATGPHTRAHGGRTR
jgi:AcrR family transcriptional regulator